MLVAERLTSGSCKDFEEYKGLIGKLQGLREAEEIVKAIFEATFTTTRVYEDGDKEDDRHKRIEFY